MILQELLPPLTPQPHTDNANKATLDMDVSGQELAGVGRVGLDGK